ncbi:MAG: HTTM domain-containing protein [Chitinophagales bacterium]
MVTNRLKSFLFKQVSGAPLIVFRIAFGIMMFLSLLRFTAKGWVSMLYIQPKFFFTYYGFEWVKPLDSTGIYIVFSVMMLATLFIAAGFLYRISALTFFILFTYVELLDKTNYLNHYYFISIISMLLCFLPATKRIVPRWAILTIQLQMAAVYFFAGIAKINTDWLLQAMPLKVWLPTRTNIPFGFLLDETVVAYIFSWCGMLFDVSIAFFLFNRKTVWYAYGVVVVFHVLTATLFPGIGMFPFIMIVCATVFLPVTFHQKVLSLFNQYTGEISVYSSVLKKSTNQYWIVFILCIHFTFQLILPFRYVLYPDNLFYHEQGFRFSWRVMLMEKAGLVFFHVKDSKGKLHEVRNSDYLTCQQEKQMSTQPDMILQFAQHLKNSLHVNEVYAEAYVTVNGRGSQLLLDPKVNLLTVQDGFANKKWILARTN